jgi:predicted metal-dependent hydrolase
VSESSEIWFGKTRIPFQIRRSERRSTVALTVERPGTLIVTAPAAATIDRLSSLVRSKAPWVIQRLRRASEQLALPTAREFVSGETFRYLGRQYRLRVVEGGGSDDDDVKDVKMDRGWIVVAVPGGREAERALEVRAALARWYRAHAQERLPARVEVWARRFGIPSPALLVREQRRRWGSCNRAGIVRLNWRIVQAPLSLVDYVIAHELDHVVRGDDGHSPAFWAQLGRVMPDYEARRDALRALGPWLEW